MSRPDSTVTVLPAQGRETAVAYDDVVVTIAPGPRNAARLVRAVGRSTALVEGVVVVGWCGLRELRLVRGRDADRLGRRLAPVVSPFVHTLRPGPQDAVRPHPLTLTGLPDGHRLFDEMVTGPIVVAAQLVLLGPEAVQRWLRLLAAVCGQVVRAEAVRVDGHASARPTARAG